MTEHNELREIVQTMKATIRSDKNNIESLIKSLDRMSLTIAKALHPSNKTPQSTLRSSSILDEAVPVIIDWQTPGIQALAKFYRREDGGITFLIDVDSHHSSYIQELLEDGFVQGLQLSSIDPQ